MKQQCPFCLSIEYNESYLPNTFFNEKKFSYVKCKQCKLHYVYPTPLSDDFLLMYPPSYQSGANAIICADLYKKINGLRFSYGKQFDLIKKYAIGKKMIDFGCGAANFVINAINNGIDCDGAEFNLNHVTLLKKEIEGSNFYVLEDFFSNPDLKYDVIRLSNVLEHLPNPRETIERLISKLNTNGILLIEGPIETNPTLALRIRQVYFILSKFIRKNRMVSHPPTHLFFSDAKNQRNFFNFFQLKELHFELSESEWPFPEKWKEAKGIGGLLKFSIARISMIFTSLNKNLGNTFIYVGQVS